ncbi:MAG TPA: hypothetical protein VJY34_26910 [Roseiarcus sp.]|nr:hypothetical protein [Roseiarcus sp.]
MVFGASARHLIDAQSKWPPFGEGPVPAARTVNMKQRQDMSEHDCGIRAYLKNQHSLDKVAKVCSMFVLAVLKGEVRVARGEGRVGKADCRFLKPRRLGDHGVGRPDGEAKSPENPKMAPQELEKVESELGNGMAPEISTHKSWYAGASGDAGADHVRCARGARLQGSRANFCSKSG